MARNDWKRNRNRNRNSGALGCGLTFALMAALVAGGAAWLNSSPVEAQPVLSLQTLVTRPSVQAAEGINSTHAILIELESGLPLVGKAQQEKTWPASLTKIMTAIVAIEELPDLQKEIVLSEGMFSMLYAADASMAGFSAGERVKAMDLLYGTILPSGAECAIGLADEISGSEEEFAELMNRKAEELGMLNTHFVNATGLHHPDHYSTVEDIAVLLRYALQDQTFRMVFTTPRYTSSPTNSHPNGVSFTSTMFRRLENPYLNDGEILGGKTGYTGEAGLCLGSLARRGDREFIFVSTGAESSWSGEPYYITDAKQVYANALGYFRERRLGHISASGISLSS